MIWNKLKKYILFYTIIFLICFIIIHFILNVFNMQFRQWVYYFTALLVIIGTSIGRIQILRTKNRKVKIIASIISICTLILIILSWQLILLALVFSYRPEHIIVKDGEKYVAQVRAFLHVYVEYYDYKNVFMMGNKIKIEEYYGDGGYDPFDEKHDDGEPIRYYYYDNNGNVIKTNVENYNRIENITSNNDSIINTTVENSKNTNSNNNILYEKNFDNKTAIRVIVKDYILAQRLLIGIEKTIDGGITWINQIESSDGVIQIHNGSKFTFINENNGFINDSGLAGTLGENRGLLVTTNGGKTFIDANIIHPNDIKEENLFVSELPYIEDEILKLKIYTINNNEQKYYVFYSEDKGVNWKLFY